MFYNKLYYITNFTSFHFTLVPIHPFRVCTGEYFYSPLHKRWGTFVVLEQPPSCSDLTCHPGHHTDQIATLSNIVFYFSCLLLSVVTSKTKAAKKHLLGPGGHLS